MKLHGLLTLVFYILNDERIRLCVLQHQLLLLLRWVPLFHCNFVGVHWNWLFFFWDVSEWNATCFSMVKMVFLFFLGVAERRVKNGFMVFFWKNGFFFIWGYSWRHRWQLCRLQYYRKMYGLAGKCGGKLIFENYYWRYCLTGFEFVIVFYVKSCAFLNCTIDPLVFENRVRFHEVRSLFFLGNAQLLEKQLDSFCLNFLYS